MPLVKIDIAKGQEKTYLKRLLKSTMDSVQKVLGLPSDDRNIRLLEYDPDLFTMKDPYKIIVEISMFDGRTIDTKRMLYKTIVDALNEILDIPREEVFIVIHDIPKENWGVRGGIAASDIELGFKVEI